MPALFVRAGNDLATATIADLEKGMAACVADLECREIKDSGHWLNAGNADRWVRICGWVILGLMAGIRLMAFF